MQVSQQRSSAKKSYRHSKDSPELKERYNDNHNQLLATKFGDVTQRGLQMTGSKELQKKKSKNQGDNTQYIRNLYKKYLGKQNSNNSQKKIKTDMKDVKTQKTLITQSCRQKLNYQGQNIATKGNVLAESTAFNHKKNNFLKKSTELEKNIKLPIYNFYEQMKDQQSLYIVGDNNSTLVRGLKIINKIRKNYK